MRITATIRAAELGTNMERTRHMTEPTDADTDHSGTGTTLDDNSVCSIGAESGDYFHDLPRKANSVLQSAKVSLKTSGNLRRDIRDTIVGSLQTLYEMVRRLANSRNRHMPERQREKAAQEKRLAGMERQHTRNLRVVEDNAREEGAAHRRLLESIASDVSAQRATSVADFDDCFERMRAVRETPRGTAGRSRERSLDGLLAIQKSLEDLRSELTGRNVPLEGFLRGKS